MKYLVGLTLICGLWSSSVGAVDFLIYTYNADGKQALYRQNLDTQETDRLTDLTYNVWTASFAPDANWLVFSSDETGNDQIYRMNADGSSRQRLTFDEEENYHPFISPDGTQIAYSRESVGEIILMNADGGNARVIAAHEQNNVHPMFSPDGKSLIFYSERVVNEAGIPGIFLYDLRTEQVRHTGYYGHYPRYAPDGAHIAFTASLEKDGKWQVFVANLEEEAAPIQVTDTAVNQNHPAFSPDGQSVYFVSWRNQHKDPATGKLVRSNEVYRANIDGSNPVRITHEKAVAWHPEVFSVRE